MATIKSIQRASAQEKLSVAFGYGEKPEVACAAIASLYEQLRHREEEIAFSLRLSGHTWQEIADVFGTSKQGAHERFARSAGLLDKLKAAKEEGTK